MAITQAVCVSFKSELLQGVHNFASAGGDTFKLALYTSSATLDASTTAYTTSNEVVGTGYTAGGNTLTNSGVSTGSGKAYTSFSNTSWSSSTITARGCLIYNSSKSNKSVVVLDFGGDKTSTAGTFTIVFPTFDSTSALLILN